MSQKSLTQSPKRPQVKVHRESESYARKSVEKFASRSADVLLAGMDVIWRRRCVGGDLGRSPVSITSARIRGVRDPVRT